MTKVNCIHKIISKLLMVKTFKKYYIVIRTI